MKPERDAGPRSDPWLVHLLATVVLSGVLQVVLGVAKLMHFVPRSVMVGFVNALAILIGWAQVPHVLGVPWLVSPMVAVGITLMVLLPQLIRAVPASTRPAPPSTSGGPATSAAVTERGPSLSADRPRLGGRSVRGRREHRGPVVS